MSKLPALGPRGEGWVVIQVLIFAAIAAAGWLLPGQLNDVAARATAGLGWALIVAGGVLALAGLVGLQGGDALTAVPHPRDSARLVEQGAYRLVRHPIYGGLVVAAVGWALARASVATLVGAVTLFVFFDLKRRREEAWLLARFPDYAGYRARTRRLIPWLW